MPVVRTNYRLTGGNLRFGGLQSVFIIDSWGSAAALGSAGPHTISMGGYGAPSFILIVGMSNPRDCASIPFWAYATQSFSGSIGWIYYQKSDGAPTVSETTRVLFAALIGSR